MTLGSLATGDVDGDGDIDIVVADTGTSTIKTMTNDGSGVFALASSVGGLGGTPRDIALGNLDGDTDLDLAITTTAAAGGAATLLNNGAGVFGSFAAYNVGAAGLGVAIGDLDGDSDRDLVVTTAGGEARSLLNNGAAVFAPAAAAFATGATPWKPHLGRFDGDAILDVAISNQGASNVSIGLGAGDGTFAAEAGSPVAAGGGGPKTGAAADVDGDSILDLVLPLENVNRYAVLKGSGTGGFAALAGSPFVIGGLEGSPVIATADFDRDGDTDMTLGKPANEGLSVLLGNNAGAFAHDTGSPIASGASTLNVDATFPSTPVAVGDLNGDTMPDIALSSGANLRILLSTFPVPTATTTTTTAAPVAVDVDFEPTTTTAPRSPTVTRAGGVERYETAVEVNADLEPGIDVAYVTTGENFPDALATGPVAGIEGAALLLVQRDAIPSSTADELSRLRPARIVVVGGVDAVSGRTQIALGAFTEEVTRIAGRDRYGTSLRLSDRAFPSGASTVYLVSGEAFAEAIASGPAAGLEGGPILLVHGSSLASDVAEEITRLDPSQVVIAGGTGSIAAGVESDLRTLFASSPDVRIVRAGGSDRFETGAMLAERVATARTGTLFVSTGEEFTDGLAATPWAIRSVSPILLVPSEGELPPSVRTFLTSHPSADVVVVGGTAAVSRSIFREIRATRV